ncbi:hydrogenase maturation nickel metallochaperone HypA [Candidatus Bathyarchaeota archaeon]|nr:MAG: hydrogenase maturation nickel metallochaperone HypA [Candidatus Bathyarchaeota archaeon]
MHEYSVAKRLFDLALKAALQYGAERVLEVRVVIGELSLVRHEQLAFWFKELSRGTVLEGAELAIEAEPGEIACPACGYRGPISLADDPAYHLALPTLRCPECGARARVVRGRDCVLKSIRIEKSEKNRGARAGPPKAGPSASGPL